MERGKREKRKDLKIKQNIFQVLGFFSLAFTEMQMFYKQITFLKDKEVSMKTERLRNI